MRVALMILLLVASVAACAGSTTPPVSNGFTPENSSVVDTAMQSARGIPLDDTGTFALPPIGRMHERLTIPANDAPKGARIDVAISNRVPGFVERTESKRANPIVSFLLRPSADVTFHGVPQFEVTFASHLQRHTGMAWLYDVNGKSWIGLGRVRFDGTRIAFGGGTAPFGLKRDDRYLAIPFADPQPTKCPSPSPTATSTTGTGGV